MSATGSAGFLHCVSRSALPAGPSAAQDYPNRPVKVVVGFPPGGGTDIAARIVTQEMSKGLGQPFLIENKPGAAGTLGAAEAARSAPDGYTLLVTPGGHAIFGAMFKSLPFHTVDSFDWISNIVAIPFFIVVPAGSEFKTLADVVAKARAAPGTITFGSTGPGIDPPSRHRTARQSRPAPNSCTCLIAAMRRSSPRCSATSLPSRS